MKRKILSALLCTVILFTMSACAAKGAKSDDIVVLFTNDAHVECVVLMSKKDTK